MTAQMLTTQELDRLLESRPTVEEALTEPPENTSLLSLLASFDRNMLAELMVEQSYKPGEVVCKEGDTGDAIYLIWSGRVAAVKGGFQAPTILGYRGPGEIIGEMALLENRPRSASIVALENLRVLRIGRESFQEWLNSNPAISLNIMATLSARLRVSDTVRTVDDHAGRQLVRRVSQLQTEKRQLLELQRLREETSDLVVHDLRNPLSIIHGVLNMLELVLPEDVLQANRELLDIANAGCRRMQRLVDSLLDIARMESGEVELRLNETDLGPLLEDAARRETVALEARGVDIQTIIAPGLPRVMVDAEKIDRVLANLIDNAIKYTPAGGVISLAAEVQSDQVVVSVTDTGPGIPPEDRERIFERFAQVPEDKPKRRGFGLGLTFCRLIVEAHDGHIWVEPASGQKGSRFCFTLPLGSSQSA